MRLAQIIRCLELLRGSWPKLAEASGINYYDIGRIARGERMPSMVKGEKLADGLRDLFPDVVREVLESSPPEGGAAPADGTSSPAHP